MKYMIVMFTTPDDALSLSEADIEAIEAKHAAFRDKYERTNILINGAGLNYRNKSTSLESTNGNIEIKYAPNDGASSEMTAYYVVECSDDEQAENIAAELLDKHVTRVEIRKIHHSNGFY